MKCPHCGHVFKPFTEYTGWLKPYLPAILEGLKQKHSPQKIADAIASTQDYSYRGMAQTIRYIAKKYGIEVADSLTKREKDLTERNKAIFLASKEGGGNISYAELGRIHGLSRDRIRQIACSEYRKRKYPHEEDA